MTSEDAMTRVGTVLSDRSRVRMLLALMDDRARTAGELARHAGVGAPTASEHLSRLREAGFVVVAAQGRHRYYRLAGPEVARLLEGLGNLDLPTTEWAGPRSPVELRSARTCYDHLAGELGVRLHDRLLTLGHTVRDDGHLRLTESGRGVLADLGAVLPETSHRPAVRSCLDWTERRDHLGGPAAAALLTALLDRGWIVRAGRPRALRVTGSGRRGLAEVLGA